ncbi:hypothetical protein MMC25_002106 [Agyrium rufum]|nr:hypothetical protein [Agyrium rufum]
MARMSESDFLASLSDLTGKISIVTGGAGGIGLETTVYLALRGCTVYVASRNRERSLKAIASAQKRVDAASDDPQIPRVKQFGRIHFHQLDLGSIKTARQSAEAFRKLESRLDIIIANAGAGLLFQNELSDEGLERTFQTNHLGHFTFIMSLLDLVEATAAAHGDARIVNTTSYGYAGAKVPNYEDLRQLKPNDGSSLLHYMPSFQRYLVSKLCNVFFTLELDRRLRERGVKNIYANCCHPGLAGATTFGDGGLGNSRLAHMTEAAIKFLVVKIGQTNADSAKTQVYLAASDDIKRNDSHGEYWEPLLSWRRFYYSCSRKELFPIGKNLAEQEKLWDFSQQAIDMVQSREMVEPVNDERVELAA